MTSQEFHELTHLVLDLPSEPPAALFAGGFDDWRARAHLAHFLANPELARYEHAKELFRSVVEQEVALDSLDEVEDKVYALQRLSAIEASDKDFSRALEHINLAIELAEETDFLYRFILRGELWAARWNLLHKLGKSVEAERECDERMEAYEDIPIEHNSYRYYGYRFKAQLAAERGDIAFIVKDYMHLAIGAMEIPESHREALDIAFALEYDSVPAILDAIDRATPNPDTLHWDI